jgi:hypothetical protein
VAVKPAKSAKSENAATPFAELTDFADVAHPSFLE